MKYRLKDYELQATLDEISGGDFTVQFTDVANLVSRALNGRNPFIRSRTVFFELKHKSRLLLSVEITPEMIEEYEE